LYQQKKSISILKIMETAHATAPVSQAIISSEQLLEHWQAHRRLTRRVIEAFPDDALYTFSIGGMRTFALLTMEMIDLAGGIGGIATGVWPSREPGADFHPAAPNSKAELLELWDAITLEMDQTWPQITPKRFQETDKAFGLYEGTIYGTILYFIDNEIHHRGQGYVYLRSLGIEPPAFWDRR
jgi:uncharacterized damage-inducible protein DinB